MSKKSAKKKPEVKKKSVVALPQKSSKKTSAKDVKPKKLTPDSKSNKAIEKKPIEVKAQKQTKSVKPALMSKKGRSVEPEEVKEVKKTKTVVSMIESPTETQDQEEKVEKTSKVKPIKVDRGNATDEKAKWLELYKKYGKEKAQGYKMTEVYPKLVPIQHKVLGWGFILTNENDRLEVLFETGIRMLISNYRQA